MNWLTGTPAENGLYWCRTTSGLGGMEVGYHALVFSGRTWYSPAGSRVTHFAVIEEPIENEFGMYADPLGRIDNVARSKRGVDLWNIGPGSGK